MILCGCEIAQFLVATTVVGNSPLNLDESPTGLGDVILILMQSPPARVALLFRKLVPLGEQSLVHDSRKGSWTSDALVLQEDEFSEQLHQTVDNVAQARGRFVQI